jgi:hypothetical protein
MNCNAPLSTRAFKHLRRITNQNSLHSTDEEIHDMGRRLSVICAVLSKPGEAWKAHFDVTEQEAAALHAIKEAAGTSQAPSARNISRSLGYASSRSGHVLLRRLLDKRLLVKRRGRLELKGDLEATGNARIS